MNFPGFSALAGAWLFLLIVPLVLFYFLKLKRPRLEVPSLALWRQVINDQRVNAPFQKFKRNLLLLLQLLMLCLLVLAAMQPFLRASPERARFVPVLIDCSASMAALDRPGGRSRLDAAKEQVGEMIDNLLPDQRMALVAFHSTARRLTEFTDNKRVLREALRRLEPADVPSRVEDALRMTHALSRTVEFGTVVMFTDGNLPPQVDFELPFQLRLQQLPAAGPNVGITALNARRTGGEQWDVFVRVEASQHGPGGGKVVLLQDGEPTGESAVVLDPSEAQRLVFRIETPQASRIEVRLHPDGFDSLTADDVAWLDLPVPRPLTVFAPPDLAAWRHALRARGDVDLFPADDGSGTLAEYDLVITDRATDASLSAAVALFVGIVPNELRSLVAIRSGSASIVDWERSSPLLQHVQLADVLSSDEPHSADGVGEGDYEELGYEVLAHGRSGPLILQRRRGAKLEYYLLFHTDRSTLPYRVGFPILLANAVEIALQQASLSEQRAVQTGVLPPLHLEPDRPLQVTGPQGQRSEAVSTADGLVSGIAAPRVGRYVLSDGGREVKQVGAALLDARETSLAAIDELQFRELSVAASETTLRSDRPLWPYFALAGFCVLLVEWWFFQRRPGG